MKMSEKHDLLTNFAAKNKVSAILAFAMAAFMADIMAVFTKTVIDATMCAITPFVYS